MDKHTEDMVLGVGNAFVWGLSMLVTALDERGTLDGKHFARMLEAAVEASRAHPVEGESGLPR